MDPYPISAYQLFSKIATRDSEVYDRTQVERMTQHDQHIALTLTNGATLTFSR